ncbi:hypothetical protein EYF80_011256 [Liparis tanakae]|uniref:Uncharacterized protein n=1 Tax=Liparis tanakae TaxID=230148 RepID=A0A4Z2IMS9_9TELE|nr:hypothetical protein EYF80_011256 [Liparis tanakae]
MMHSIAELERKGYCSHRVHKAVLGLQGHPSPHAIASGPNVDETNERNLDKCAADWETVQPDGSHAKVNP